MPDEGFQIQLNINPGSVASDVINAPQSTQVHAAQSSQSSQPSQPSQSSRPRVWDEHTWLQCQARAEAERDYKTQKSLKARVAADNYHHFIKGCRVEVPKTQRISTSAAQQILKGIAVHPTRSIVEVFMGTTYEAALALHRHASVCALNFANGAHPGGGYVRGARAQEEELCRQWPTLYSSLLYNKRRCYPFGPASSKQSEYSDVLFTPNLTCMRAAQKEGYRHLSTQEKFSCSMVAAAAPNRKCPSDVFDPERIKETIRNILVVGAQNRYRADVMILGAWGCGAFYNDPEVMANLFADVLDDDFYNRLYSRVVFAIPQDGNLPVFHSVLERRCGATMLE